MSNTTAVERFMSLPRAMAALVVAAGLSVLLMACSGEGTAPVPTPVVFQVIVEPAEAATIPGGQLSYTARVLDQDGGEIIGSPVSWSSTNENVATVSESGVVTAIGEGYTYIRAESGTKAGTGVLDVLPAPVATVAISPGAMSLTEGTSHQFSAVAKDAAGRELSGRLVTWSTSDASIATVDGSGRVTAMGVGRAAIRATVEEMWDAVELSVTAAPITQITISPAAGVIEIGEVKQYAAVVTDALGRPVQNAPVQWSVDNPNATITAGGVLTGMKNGYVTITASSGGVSTSVAATIIDPDPLDVDLLYYRVQPGGDSEIFTLALSGGTPPVRLNAGTVSRSPTASPDGLRIAFAVSMIDFGSGLPVDDIFAVDRNGMNMKRLTNAEGADDSPAWSPVSGMIAYRHADPGGRSDIWLMNPDGSGPVNLTADMPAAGERREPAWSRDGQRIAFSQSEYGNNGTTTSIWTMRADGSDKRMLTSTLSGFDSSPTWSPDGQRLAFVRYYSGESDITIIDVNTGVMTRVPRAGYEASPSWSPDGSLIAFTLNGHDIYTMRPDGNRVRLRTVDAAWGGGLSPVWIKRLQ